LVLVKDIDKEERETIKKHRIEQTNYRYILSNVNDYVYIFTVYIIYIYIYILYIMI